MTHAPVNHAVRVGGGALAGSLGNRSRQAAAADADEIVKLNREHAVRMSGRSVHRIETAQTFVDKNRQRRLARKRRNTADGEPSRALHRIGVGAFYFARQIEFGAQGAGVAAPVAGDERHNGCAANGKHQRFYDGAEVAAQACGGVLRGARGGGKLDDLRVRTRRRQRLDDAADRRAFEVTGHAAPAPLEQYPICQRTKVIAPARFIISDKIALLFKMLE